MKTLIQKELRLQLPAFGIALALATLPVWLAQSSESDTAIVVAMGPFLIGAVMLSLAPFGREFGLGTFLSLLSQPVERRLLWKTKTIILAACLVIIFAVWCLSCLMFLPASDNVPLPSILFAGAVAATVSFTGSLWTTLVLRQVAAAFWITLLIPLLILLTSIFLGVSGTITYVALGIYAISSYVLARRHFFRIEDHGWTGGVITLPAWRSRETLAQAGCRQYRPISALVRKEFQLLQVMFYGMALLFLIHLVVILIRKYGEPSFDLSTEIFAKQFGLIWIFVPLLACAPSVAEERKLGTIDLNACLPVSMRLQFIIKLVFAVLVGLLGAFLLWTAEVLGTSIGVQSMFSEHGSDITGLSTFLPLALIFLGLSLTSFYASTVARNILQALGASVVTLLAIGLFLRLAANPRTWGNGFVWKIELFWIIAGPALVAVIFWRMLRNFRRVSDTRSLWQHNGMSVVATMALICCLTYAISHRAWEFLSPVEPPHGPARLTPGKTTLQFELWNICLVHLPDGRLWANRIWYNPGQNLFGTNSSLIVHVGGKWNREVQYPFLYGSNWVNAVASTRDIIAIHSDGSLWVSEKPWSRPHMDFAPLEERPPEMIRAGTETGWKSVAVDYSPRLVYLLKSDGTLWEWGRRPSSSNVLWAANLLANPPRRLGQDRDWQRIVGTGGQIFIWKTNGEASRILHVKNPEAEGGYAAVTERAPAFDGIYLRSIARPVRRQCMGVREDGTLWAWELPTSDDAKMRNAQPKLQQIGTGTNWVSVVSRENGFVGLKSDGSLWKWLFASKPYEDRLIARKPPVLLSRHTDWVALSGLYHTVALAADGSMWQWWTPDYWASSFDQPLLSASRKPVRIGSIFDSEEKNRLRPK